MKNQELYQRSVDILLDAYNAGELTHADCRACAVGNLVRANGGFAIDRGYRKACWDDVFCTTVTSQRVSMHRYNGNAKREIDQTGYSVEDLAKIEFAFENSIAHSYIKYAFTEIKQGQFIGLTAVLNVLREIHEVDTDSHEENQTKLTAIYNKFQLA